MQCRRIFGGRKLLVYVHYAVTAIFDFVTEEDEGRVKTVTLRVGARAKERKGEGEGRKTTAFFLLSLPTPSFAPFESPRFLLWFGVSTWRFHEQNIRTPEENACTEGNGRSFKRF